jgi:hypothetical protein
MDVAEDTFIQKHQLKAEEYRSRAREAFVAAEGATLDRVREQRRASAEVWADMAEAEARLVTRRAHLSESAK